MSAITINVVKETPTFASAFWLTGVLLRCALSAAVFGLSQFSPLPLFAFVLVVALDLAAFVGTIIRYSIAGNLYLNSTGRFWTVVGGYAFFFLASPAVLITWFLLFQSTGVEMSARDTDAGSARPSYNNTRFINELSRNRSQLTFKGVIAQGAATEIAEMLEGGGESKTLVLSSPGGNVFEARDMAREVQRNDVNTHVTNECNASCLLVYLAGTQRSLGPGAKLGLHSYGLDFSQLLPHVSPLKELRTDQQYFLQRGVSPWFVAKAFELDRDAIWYPSRQELIDAGVVTEN